ncbi:hypothetical protein [Actinomadura sp. HBU206391]|uniref:hypothetical protein n=1 Tax=Actinomadura sp. HBU206391 TaxID=2731692 RepID=UPI00164FFB97|nr:hypothetical protein [Actinomadura sp. HBU206391]MBC6461291.1 hypothetical protein [Actinomadura sp. HBU206391]
MNQHVADRPTGGEMGMASRALLLLLGLLGFVLSPAIAPPPATASMGQGVAQQTVSPKKSAAQGTPRGSRGGRGSAHAEQRCPAAQAVAASAHPPCAQAHGSMSAVPAGEAAAPVPADTFAGRVSGPLDPVSGTFVGTPRSRAPPTSTGF